MKKVVKRELCSKLEDRRRRERQTSIDKRSIPISSRWILVASNKELNWLLVILLFVKSAKLALTKRVN